MSKRSRFVTFALAAVLALAGATGCASRGGSDEGKDETAVVAEPEAGTEEDAAAEDPEGEETDVVVEDDFPPDSEEAGTEFVHDKMVEEAEASGRLVITGTLRIVTATELCELQEAPAEMAESFGGDASSYAIVVFDEPQMLAVMHSGDFGTPYEGEASMVAVAIDEDNEWGHEGDMSVWEPYDGQVVTVSIDPNETLFPSDVRLPMGQPHTSSAELLFAE